MFAIYDIEGRRFRNTLENLRKVREVQSSAETLLWSNSAEGEARAIAGGNSGANTQESIVSSKAVQAYREMRHLNRREPIYHAHRRCMSAFWLTAVSRVQSRDSTALDRGHNNCARQTRTQ
jgi:acetoin utilization protein AcuB